MAKKPSYEELEKIVEELKKKVLQNEKIKETLRDSEDRYRRITEAVSDYVFNVRIENGHPVETVHGRGCVVVTGYTPEDFDTDPYLWILMVHKEDHKLVQEQAQRVLLGKKIQPIEHRILRKDGVIRWVMNTLVPHYNQQGDLLSYDGIVRDIDDRKKAEEELKKAHDELEVRIEKRTKELVKANAKLRHEIEERRRLEKILMQKERLKALGAIIAEVAHEIRNPLVSIGGFARRLKKKFRDCPECDIILSESRRLEKILSKIGRYIEPVEIHPRECSINTIITTCLNHLSPEMKRRELTCVLELCPTLPVAYADPEILPQIFIDLTRNAVDVMEKGGSLLVKTFESNQDLHIEFKNQAPGFKIKDTETLFMPFTEGDQSLGLPQCHRLIKHMDGVISFVQEKDCFVITVSLPKRSQPLTEKRVQNNSELNMLRDPSMYG